MPPEQLSNIEQAQQLSKSILDDLEIGEIPINAVLLNTKRLARLLHDSDAQQWLNIEISGCSKEFDFKSLGACQKYFRGFHTFGSDNIPLSLPSLEIAITHPEMLINTYEINLPFGKFLELKKCYDTHKLEIHNYVDDVHLSLLIGDIAENIFQETRETVDTFLQENCEKDVKEKLLAINERLREDNKEAYSQALLSCRRILESIADSIYPPKDEPYIGKDGKKHEIGKNNYVNRILAYIEHNSSSQTKTQLQLTNFQHLVARLDALNDESQKGVHDKITKEEARLTIIQMYLFIAEIARIKDQNFTKSD